MKISLSEGILLFSFLIGTTDCQYEEYDSDDYIYVDYAEWEKIYPPKDPKDPSKDLTMEGWQKILAEQKLKYEERQKFSNGRSVQFCVDGKLPFPPHGTDPDLAKFIPMIEYLNNNPKIELKPGKKNGGSPTGLIEKIEFYSIYSPDPPSKTNEDGIGIGRLNQWAHLSIVASKPLQGLYIQAISGPLGLPFGEFRTDFECKINGKLTDAGTPSAKIVPCKYRPRTAVRHPMVYAYTGSAKSEFHVHFNWEDVKCAEAVRMQFLILATEKFDMQKDGWEVYKTPSYEQKVDSYDGIPYPYYVQWSDPSEPLSGMKCTQDDMNQERYQFIYNDKTSPENIKYNQEYHECILHNTGLNLDKYGQTCPPGPFHCLKRSDNTPAKVDSLREQYIKDTALASSCPGGRVDCKSPEKTEKKVRTTIKGPTKEPTSSKGPEDPSSSTEMTGPPITNKPADPVFEEVKIDFMKRVLGKSTRESNAFHGQMMTLSWSVLLVIGTILARFYKETAGLNALGSNGCLGIGPWLWGHTLLAVVGASTMWVGVFEVVHIHDIGSIPCENYNPDSALQLSCQIKRNVVYTHTALGIVSLICFHVCFITGFIRPLGTKIRKTFVFTHMCTGYVGKLFSVISIVVLFGSKAICGDILAEILGFEIVTIILFIAMSFVQKREDRRLEGKPRKQFPMIEAVETPWEGAPTDKFKIFLHVLNWVLHISMYVGVVATYAKLFGNVQDGELNQFDTPDYLVLMCQLPSVKTDLQILQCLDTAGGIKGCKANLTVS